LSVLVPVTAEARIVTDAAEWAALLAGPLTAYLVIRRRELP
jgi:hypothetical protein